MALVELDVADREELLSVLRRALVAIELLRQAQRVAAIGGAARDDAARAAASAAPLLPPLARDVAGRIAHARRFMGECAALSTRCYLARGERPLLSREQLLLSEVHCVARILVGEQAGGGGAVRELSRCVDATLAPMRSLTFRDLVAGGAGGAAHEPAAAAWAAGMVPAFVRAMVVETAAAGGGAAAAAAQDARGARVHCSARGSRGRRPDGRTARASIA